MVREKESLYEVEEAHLNISEALDRGGGPRSEARKVGVRLPTL